MEYVRRIDFDAINNSGAQERLTQELLGHASGAKTAMIRKPTRIQELREIIVKFCSPANQL